MMKSLAIGLLTLSATCSTAALARDSEWQLPPPDQNLGWLCRALPFLPFCDSHKQGGGGVVAAPEIDPASAAAALTLLAGGLAALRGRRSAKQEF